MTWQRQKPKYDIVKVETSISPDNDLYNKIWSNKNLSHGQIQEELEISIQVLQEDLDK